MEYIADNFYLRSTKKKQPLKLWFSIYLMRHNDTNVTNSAAIYNLAETKDDAITLNGDQLDIAYPPRDWGIEADDIIEIPFKFIKQVYESHQ